MNPENKKSRPRTAKGVQRLNNRDLAELTAVAETELLANMRLSQQTALALHHRLAWVRRAVNTMKLLNWCYVELLRRAEHGELSPEATS